MATRVTPEPGESTLRVVATHPVGIELALAFVGSVGVVLTTPHLVWPAAAAIAGFSLSGSV